MAQLRIFVSHSSHDNAWCQPFAEALKAVGYDVWYDETGLQGGAAWVDSIQKEVENRDVFLLVLTPEAWESKWVQDELQLAIATRRRILPVLLRNTQVSGFLLTTQWITVIGEEPQSAARAAIMAIEAPPAPGRDAAPPAATETLDDLMTLCRSLTTERQYTEALSACGRALALGPDNIEVVRLRGWVLLQINEPYKAAETWGRVLSLAPSEQVAKMAVEVVSWLRQHCVIRLNLGNLADMFYPEYVSDAWTAYLAPLITHLTSSTALYEVAFEIAEIGNSPGLPKTRELASKVRNSGVLRAALVHTIARYLSEAAIEANSANISEMQTVEELQAVFDAQSYTKRYPTVMVFLSEGCYGYPPDKATAADVEGLRYYKDALAKLGWQEESAVVEQYVHRLSLQR